MKISSQNQISKKELEALADIRIAEAQALMEGGHYSGAYYLAGYAVEFALKAIIASTFLPDTIPDKKHVDSIYVHNLTKLASLAGVDARLTDRSCITPEVQANWLIVEQWSEHSRYRNSREDEAQGLLLAVAGPNGVVPWLKIFFW
jgi:HEPN domain-containing protein